MSTPTVFQMDSSGVVTLVYAFPNGTSGTNPTNGSSPFAALVQGTNGLLYGRVFKLTPGGVLTGK